MALTAKTSASARKNCGSALATSSQAGRQSQQMCMRTSIGGTKVSGARSPLRQSSSRISATKVEARKRSVSDLAPNELSGKTVLERADLNVPLDDDRKITDDTRIRYAVPTIEHLIKEGAKVVLSTHLGRPKGEGYDPKFSLEPVEERLRNLLSCQVTKLDDSINVDDKVKDAPGSSVVLLENVRFYKEETDNDAEFAKKLAGPCDLFVHDAFGTAHRAHASTEGVTHHLKPNVSGFLLQKELDYLDQAVASPTRPFAAIIGGSKVSGKIEVIESLLQRCDQLFLGGGMIFTFFRAKGYHVGGSLVEEDKVELAKELMQKAEDKGVSLQLPTDVTVADAFAEDANTQVVPVEKIPEGWMGLDIGPDTIKSYQSELKRCKTVLWNGPMGVFEFDKFAKGTFQLAEALSAMSEATTIIGGGDSVSAVDKAGLSEKMSHISTGGGASLELLEGKTLPGVAALDEA